MNNKGFTLIEIIIVIVILGIMASLALPKITGQIDRGRIPQGLEQLGKIQREADQCIQLSTSSGDCDSLTDLGYSSAEITVNGWEYTMTANTISATCTATTACSSEATVSFGITLNTSGHTTPGLDVGTRTASGAFRGFKFSR